MKQVSPPIAERPLAINLDRAGDEVFVGANVRLSRFALYLKALADAHDDKFVVAADTMIRYKLKG